jgi:hypothetical protein
MGLQVYEDMLQELSERFEGSWFRDDDYRLRGFGPSDLWLRMDHRIVDQANPFAPITNPSWDTVRIDMVRFEHATTSYAKVVRCGPFEDADECARVVREMIEEIRCK